MVWECRSGSESPIHGFTTVTAFLSTPHLTKYSFGSTRTRIRILMGFTGEPEHHAESSLLLSSTTVKKIPEDKYHLAYIIYFIIGFGYLLPWNAFITAVDYFSYLYPDVSVDRIFAVVYMLVGLVGIFLIILYSHKSDAYVRINVGLALFVVSLLVVPLLDAFYVKGRVGLYDGFYVTAGAVGLSAVADALVQGSVVGSAGELPERYMQAVIAGTAGSGTLTFSISSSYYYFWFNFSSGVSKVSIKIQTLMILV